MREAPPGACLRSAVASRVRGKRRTRSSAVRLPSATWIVVAAACFPLLADGAAAQGVASVLMRHSEGPGINGSFSGELVLTTDTLIFLVESGTIENHHRSKVAIESVTLALRAVQPDGSWSIVHRGGPHRLDVGLIPGQSLEVDELFLGLIVPGLLTLGELRPMVVITPLVPDHATEGWALLDQSLSTLFDLRPGAVRPPGTQSVESRARAPRR